MQSVLDRHKSHKLLKASETIERAKEKFGRSGREETVATRRAGEVVVPAPSEVTGPAPSEVVGPALYEVVLPTPFQAAGPAPFEAAGPAPYEVVFPTPFEEAGPAPYEVVFPTPFEAAGPAPYELVVSAPFEAAGPAPYELIVSAPFEAAGPAPYELVVPAPFQVAGPTPYELEDDNEYDDDYCTNIYGAIGDRIPHPEVKDDASERGGDCDDAEPETRPLAPPSVADLFREQVAERVLAGDHVTRRWAVDGGYGGGVGSTDEVNDVFEYGGPSRVYASMTTAWRN